MLCGAAVDAYSLTVETQFTGVASRASYVQILLGAARILVSCETDRKVARVVWRGFLLRINQKAKACEVFRGGEALLREWQLQCLEPLIAQPFDLCALGREVIGLPLLFSPLIQVMHLLGRGVEGQFRVGDVIQNHRKDESQQERDQGQNAE